MDRFTVRLSSSHKPSGNTKPLVFKNPILTASGTFGYGVEFANYGDLTHLGGIVVKGLSLKPRPGNPLPRVAETPCGMLNAVGLQNDGVESFLKNKLPRLPWHETPVIANLYATSPAEFAELAGILKFGIFCVPLVTFFRRHSVSVRLKVAEECAFWKKRLLPGPHP